MLHEAKDAGKVDVDDRIPVFFGVVDGRRAPDNAGIVDENVDGAEVLDSFLDQARADGGVPHIAGQGNASGAGCGDKFLGVFGRVNGAMHRDVGSGFSQRDSDACT
jgi:hypothetical protein